MPGVQQELATLVAFPTVSNRPVTALAAHLSEAAERLGFHVEHFDPGGVEGKRTVIATIGQSDRAGLVISGHMDVVPTEGQPWSSDPFRVREADGVLFGRGTADMKGFIAAVMCALARIPARDYRRELMLAWTHDEEIGCLGSAALAEAWAGRPVPTACWIGEPTEFRIQRMHPGHVAIEMSTRGRAAHSSRPDLGLNAIEGGVEVVRAAQELAAELRDEAASDLPEMERPWVALNVAEIQGGVAINVVPDKCTIRIGYRPLPGRDPLEVWHRLQRKVQALGLATAFDGKVLRVTPSLLTAEGTSLQPLLEAHAAHPGCSAATFATDGGNLAKLGMEPLIFGPGSITVAHQADEHVALAELVRTVDLVEAVVRARCCAGA